MLRLLASSVRARKLRMLLTSIAIVLGVSFIAGAYFLTDSMRSSFDDLFTEAAAGIDVQVTSVEYKELQERALRSPPGTVPIDLARVGIPPEAVDRVRRLPGVELAEGTVFENGAQPLDRQGRLVGSNRAPTFAAGWVDGAEQVSALRIVEGRAPRRGEVLLDEHTMKEGRFQVGDAIRVLVQGGRKTVDAEVVGVVRFGSQSTLLGASITVFEQRELQRLLDMGDRTSAISVVAEEGISEVALKQRIERELGTRYQVLTGAEFSQEQSEGIDSAFLDILQSVILAFAYVAVFVGAFTIFNTFTILVTQRTREFGLLRALGASRGQVVGVVLLESIVIGVLASTLAIFAGYGLAYGLRALLNLFEFGLPGGGFPVEARTIAVSYSVGVLVTVFASAVPAWRASRLSPLEALRVTSATGSRGWGLPAVGAPLAVAGAALVVVGFRLDGAAVTTKLSLIGGGFAVAIIGIALLSRLFVGPVAQGLATVVARGLTGQLALRNVLRNRGRASITAAALMIGLALASLVLVFFTSLTRTVDAQIDEVIGADITIYNAAAGNGAVALVSDRLVERIRGVDGVRSAVGQRAGGMQLRREFDAKGHDVESLVAFDEGALDADGAVRITLVNGSNEPRDGLLVDEDLAEERGLEVGDRVTMSFPTATSRRLRVRGIFEPSQVVGAHAVVSTVTFDKVEPEQLRATALLYIGTADGESPKRVARRIERSLGRDSRHLKIQDSEDLRATFREQLVPIIGLVLAMLSMSLVIALIGIATTLALNVFERTREIGLLRAVGSTQRQVRRLIRIEAVLVALFGAVVGVLVGVAAGSALVLALSDHGFLLSISPLLLGAVLLAGLLAGLLASVLPARRAARIDVLRAIATE